MLEMETYYEIMHYLKGAKFDRQYPVILESGAFDDEGNDLLLWSGEKFVFDLCHDAFKGIDFVQVLVKSSVDVDNITPKIGFCIDDEGDLPILEASAPDQSLVKDKTTLLEFKIDENYTMADISNNLTGISKFSLNFGVNVVDLKILSIIFRSYDYTHTLSDLDKSYADGERYVIDKLNSSDYFNHYEDYPEQLEKYVLMCAGAYAWLTVWEYEAKPMKEQKAESNNYADRLFGKIDAGIKAYLDSIYNNPEDNYLNPKIIGHTKMSWGLR
jgi:hypothetical protein